MLTAEDQSQLGGPMGTERTYTLWTRLFQTLDGAKEFAKKNYAKQVARSFSPLWEPDKFRWMRQSNQIVYSDQGWIGYTITRMTVQK